MPLPSDIQEELTGMALHFSDKSIAFIPHHNTNLVNNNNDLSHSTSVLQTDIFSTQLSTDVSDEHPQTMSNFHQFTVIDLVISILHLLHLTRY